MIMFQSIFRDSTCLREITHDGISLVSVRFASSPENIYQYYPVTLAQVKRIVNAESVGKMFHLEIQDNPEVIMIRKIAS